MVEEYQKGLILEKQKENKETSLPQYHIQYFQDSCIRFSTSGSGEVVGDFWVINTNENTSFKRGRIRPDIVYDLKSLEDSSDLKFSVSTDRKDKRVIENYPCFKVRLTFEADTDDEFDILFGKRVMEMYVTELIDRKFHPTVYFPEVLAIGYPLLVIDYYENSPGSKDIHKPLVLKVR